MRLAEHAASPRPRDRAIERVRRPRDSGETSDHPLGGQRPLDVSERGAGAAENTRHRHAAAAQGDATHRGGHQTESLERLDDQAPSRAWHEHETQPPEPFAFGADGDDEDIGGGAVRHVRLASVDDEAASAAAAPRRDRRDIRPRVRFADCQRAQRASLADRLEPCVLLCRCAELVNERRDEIRLHEHAQRKAERIAAWQFFGNDGLTPAVGRGPPGDARQQRPPRQSPTTLPAIGMRSQVALDESTHLTSELLVVRAKRMNHADGGRAAVARETASMTS